MASLRDNIGLGLVNRRHPTPGEARECLNMHIGTREGRSRVEIRLPVTPLYDTNKWDNLIYGLYELRKDDGTHNVIVTTRLEVINADNDAIIYTYLDQQLTRPSVGFTNLFDKLFIVNGGESIAVNEVNGGPLVEANPGGTLPATELGAAAAIGFGIGAFEYQYTYGILDPSDARDGWETLPSATTIVNKSIPDQGVLISLPSGLAAPYNRVRIYRRLQFNNSWYLVAEKEANEFPFTDDLIDLALTDAFISEVHNNDTGLATMQIPPTPATDCEGYRGRLFVVHEDVLYWSKVGLPFVFKSDGAAQKEIGDDGDPILRVVNWGEALVIFKKYSIWIMQGDVLEPGFVFFPVTKTIGLMFSGGLVKTPLGIFFMSSDGDCYVFNLTLESLSTNLNMSFDMDKFLVLGIREPVYCGWCPEQNMVFLTLADQTLAFYLDGGGWAEHEFPTTLVDNFVEVTVGNFRRLGVATREGRLYILEHPDAFPAQGDGCELSGTINGTITSSAPGTFTDSGANIYNSGDGLDGVQVAIFDTDGVLVDLTVITGNTDTVVTISNPATPTVGHTYKIGPMSALIRYASMDDQNPQFKRLDRCFFTFESLPGTFQVGMLLDEDDTLNTDISITPTAQANRLLRVGKRAFRFAPFIIYLGNDGSMSLISIEYNAAPVRGII